MKILSKIKPINGADFKIADAKDIAIGDSNVEEKILNLQELANKNLKSPDGTFWRITIDNNGNLKAEKFRRNS